MAGDLTQITAPMQGTVIQIAPKERLWVVGDR